MGNVGLIGWLTALVSDTTMALVEHGALLWLRQLDMGNSGLDAQGDRVDLLVSETGSFDGSKAVGIEESGGHILDISADGNWTVSIMHPMLLAEALRARGNKADCASTGCADCASRQASQHQSSVV